MRNRYIILWMAVFMVFSASCPAQQLRISGKVKELQNDEPVAFASIQMMRSGKGTITDSAGNFSLLINSFSPDSLIITSVGFKRFTVFINTGKDSIGFTGYLERGGYAKEVVVTAKPGNKGLLVWKRIVKHKPENDRGRFANYAYELYNKLEIDWNKFSKDKAKRIPFVRSFAFIFDNVDSSETNPFLPVYLTETLSDYYYQSNPKKFKEIIKAQKADGIENESMSKFLGGMYQNVNAYNNFLPVFDKDFASPLSDHGDAYYNYRVADTQVIGGRRFFHLLFAPKHKGENAFEGDCWVDAQNYGIKKITLQLPADANVNYVEDLSMIQEFSLQPDSTWFLTKDKFVADLYLVAKNKLNFKGSKTTTYRNISVNQNYIADTLSRSGKEEVVFSDSTRLHDAAFWKLHRHEALTKNEAGIYKMIDTLTNLPRFKKLTNTLNFIGTGYKRIGNYEIGPWYNWISGNSLEGTRFRFDLGTSYGFSRKYYLHGYLAYGTKDQRIKGKMEIFDFFSRRNPRNYIHLSYKNDIDNGQNYFDEIGTDNIFALAVRKKNVPSKFMNIESVKLEYFNEWKSGFSAMLTLENRNFTPLKNLPAKSFFSNKLGAALNNAEVGFKVRYAYLERFIDDGFFRTSLGSDYPIVEFRMNKGLSGIFGSSYDYTKLHAGASDFMKIAPYGSLYYNVYAGKVIGTIPYMLLEIPPGNEIYYYDKYAFNLMNRYEFVTDRYAGFTVEHNIGNGIFGYFAPTRKLKWRQFWNAKALVGGLTPENKLLNFVGDYPYSDLGSKVYLEIGTGVDNIFKLLRLDAVWRVAPSHLPGQAIKSFGLFGSFRIGF